MDVPVQFSLCRYDSSEHSADTLTGSRVVQECRRSRVEMPEAARWAFNNSFAVQTSSSAAGLSDRLHGRDPETLDCCWWVGCRSLADLRRAPRPGPFRQTQDWHGFRSYHDVLSRAVAPGHDPDRRP